MGGRTEGTQGQAKTTAWNSFSYFCTRALHSFRSFAHWRAASIVIPLLPKATFTPSIQLTSVSLVPSLQLLPPSKPFWPNDTHTFFPHAQTISILCNLLYSLTLFIFQLSYTHHSFVTLSIRDTPLSIDDKFLCVRIFVFPSVSQVLGASRRTLRLRGHSLMRKWLVMGISS